MSLTERQSIAKSAAGKLASLTPGHLSSHSAVVGFDGFVDSIIQVVDRRRDMTPGGYDRIRSIGEFASRAAAAAGKSTNMELVTVEDRFGGNGPLMAGALGRLGLPLTYIGAVGHPDNPRQLHPIYKELAERCRRVVPVCAPAATDALEFDDGKIMFNKPGNIQGVTWDHLKRTVGLAEITRLISPASLVGIVNWTIMAGVEGIWRGLTEEILAPLKSRQSRVPKVFIDLSDPAKRADADLAAAMQCLRQMNRAAQVTLGLNLAEAQRLDAVMGTKVFADANARPSREKIVEAAERLVRKLSLACVVIHPREGAAAATDQDESAWFEGPFTRTPKLSTGAGDHFNGGFAFGQTIGLSLPECLAAGTAVSGAYVRDAESPTLPRLAQFLAALPVSEQA